MDLDDDEDDDSGSSASGGSRLEEHASVGITLQQWRVFLSKVAVDRSAMNALVMDYLVVEGLDTAAEAFHKESGIGGKGFFGSESAKSMNQRVAIVSLIKSGHVSDAIDRINEVDCQLLDCNETLCFRLKTQALIELIRAGELQSALIFAQQTLAPRALANPDFLKVIEDVMCLFVFDDLDNCPLSHMVSQVYRNEAATMVNIAILERTGQDKDTKLLGLFRSLAWAEARLDKIISFPTYQELTSASSAPAPVDRMEQDS